MVIMDIKFKSLHCHLEVQIPCVSWIVIISTFEITQTHLYDKKSAKCKEEHASILSAICYVKVPNVIKALGCLVWSFVECQFSKIFSMFMLRCS